METMNVEQIADCIRAYIRENARPRMEAEALRLFDAHLAALRRESAAKRKGVTHDGRLSSGGAGAKEAGARQ
jgi:hypothetical protein